MQHHYTKDTVTPLNSCNQWGAYGRVGALKQWVEELKACYKPEGQSSERWRLLGRAAMISHPDKDQHLELVAKVASEAGMNLIELAADDFMSWVVEKKVPTEQCPALVYVPQGAWSAKHEEGAEIPEAVREFRKALPTYLADLDPNLALVFVSSGSSYDNLDPSLRFAGVFDRRFLIPEPTHEELGWIFMETVGLDLCDGSLKDYPRKVGRLIEIEFNEKRRYGLIALAMQRRAHREKRLLNFDDLVYFSVFGSAESDHPQETDPEKLERTAIHEAGHVVVSILDSGGQNIPDYVGLVSNHEFQGLATESFAFNQSRLGNYTFWDSCHKVRVSFGGRAAEAITLGAEKVSSIGARSDLVNASYWAKDLIGRCGFTADHGEADGHTLNLLVFDEEPTPSEAQYIESAARSFLAKQYAVAERLIRENQPLFHAIKDALLEKLVLTQADLREIAKMHV